ncbi:unnamed protein product [Spirodela intermedia]|uniref:Co-chaperone protein p23 n=1 Tax=Spirodela intermedia TaxID=51605 RepID=A0A7I8K7R7_SPIIN|nr:unnamed protein product [Spirodela intermedia]
MSRHPTTKWAQRSDEVYLKIELPDAKDVSLELQPEGKFIFSATKDGVPYEIEIELFDKINVEESKATVGVRHIAYVIKKAEKKWWSRILKQEGKPPAFLKVDWDRWVDEEDEDETERVDVDKKDFSDEEEKTEEEGQPTAEADGKAEAEVRLRKVARFHCTLSTVNTL